MALYVEAAKGIRLEPLKVERDEIELLELGLGYDVVERSRWHPNLVCRLAERRDLLFHVGFGAGDQGAKVGICHRHMRVCEVAYDESAVKHLGAGAQPATLLREVRDPLHEYAAPAFAAFQVVRIAPRVTVIRARLEKHTRRWEETLEGGVDVRRGWARVALRPECLRHTAPCVHEPLAGVPLTQWRVLQQQSLEMVAKGHGADPTGLYCAVMPALPITLCISTRNAASHLVGCIDSARAWVSEILIVDMESSDETLAIAESYHAKVIHAPPAGWAEPGRQLGIDAASQPWVLVLDADERAGVGLEALARSYLERSDVDGVWLPRQNFWFGWWVPQSGIWPDWQLRLFRQDRTTWPGHRTHVSAQVAGASVYAPERVENAIVHYSYPTLSEWAAGMNHYTDLEVERLLRDGRRSSLPRLLGVPVLRFGETYFRNGGYRGRRYGLVVGLMAFCYWLIAELKLWQRTFDRRDLPKGSMCIPVDGGPPSSSAPEALPAT